MVIVGLIRKKHYLVLLFLLIQANVYKHTVMHMTPKPLQTDCSLSQNINIVNNYFGKFATVKGILSYSKNLRFIPVTVYYHTLQIQYNNMQRIQINSKC